MKNQPFDKSRRGFLKGFGIGTAVAVGGAALASVPVIAEEKTSTDTLTAFDSPIVTKPASTALRGEKVGPRRYYSETIDDSEVFRQRLLSSKHLDPLTSFKDSDRSVMFKKS